MSDEFEFTWDFGEQQKLKSELEIAKECISDLRNLGFHNEAVKVCADDALKRMKETK